MAKQPMNSTAKELYRAAVAMHDMTRLAAPYIKPRHEKEQPAVYLGYYFNLGFAVELYLKAFLRDVTGEDVSRYGHDLSSLLDGCLSNGFNHQANAIKDIVNLIGEGHKKYTFRYAEGADNFIYINQLDLVDVALSACRDGMAHLH